MASMIIKIRARQRRNRPPDEPDGVTSEFQVVHGRYIHSRHDTSAQAEQAATALRKHLIDIRARLNAQQS